MRVAIIIIAHKKFLEKYEEISLKQCFKILFNHDIFLICPEGLDVSVYRHLYPNIKVDFINPKWQSSYSNFNRLKILPFIYQRYEQYDYILFYEPDAFVFKDDLLNWCNKGIDYVGAPWFEGFSHDNGNAKITGVGNGGFSLRKVSSHLKVLNSFAYVFTFQENIHRRFATPRDFPTKLRKFFGLLKDLTFANNTYKYLNTYDGLEDQFWGIYVSRKFKFFKVATIEEASLFSIEMQPQRLMAHNNNVLPFGCHAWWKYDLQFWKPHIESFGYRL